MARVVADPDSAQAAYTAGLRMLAGRELSTVQLGRRLQRQGFSSTAITDALSRLSASGTLDDRRVALAAARTHARVKRQGRGRVLRELAARGIEQDVATEAVSDVFGDLDEASLLEDALTRRLRGKPSLADPAVRRRITAALVRQGFAVDAVLRAVRARAGR